MLKAHDSGGAIRTIAAIKSRDQDNVLQTIGVGMGRNAAGALKLVFGSLSAPLSSDTVFGKLNTSLSVAITTRSVTVTPDGGAAPYSFAWAQTGSTGGTWSINSASVDTTTFTGGNCGPGDSFSATFHCTVTDAVGNTVTTGTVTATVSNIGFNVSGGGGPLP